MTLAENLRSKHAFGSEANVDSALASGAIDAYDILFLNEGKIGWIDKDGKKVIVETSGVDESVVDEKISAAQTSILDEAKAYADEQVASAVAVEIVEF